MALLLVGRGEGAAFAFADAFEALLALPRVNLRVAVICEFIEPLEVMQELRSDSVSGRSVGWCAIMVERRMNLTG